MDLGLTSHVAIVAAASKGLGRGVAEELAREGAHIAICARNAVTLAETAAHIQAISGREVFHQVIDVADSAAVTGFIAAAEAASAALTFVLPIPAALRLTCLEIPNRKIGALPSTSF